jgi:hypothetical protein
MPDANRIPLFGRSALLHGHASKLLKDFMRRAYHRVEDVMPDWIPGLAPSADNFRFIAGLRDERTHVTNYASIDF